MISALLSDFDNTYLRYLYLNITDFIHAKGLSVTVMSVITMCYKVIIQV